VHPVLFRIGGLEIGSYGVALALAFVVGIAFAYRRAPARGFESEIVLDTGIAVLLAALVGSRAFFLWLHPEILTGPEGSLLRAFLPIRADGQLEVMGGLSVMGGLPAALAAGAALLAWKKVPILAYMDVMAPSVALGAGITRLGCFLNGCCFGSACGWPWAVAFPAGSLPDRALPGLLVHPSQLYAALAAFGIFAFLLWIDRHSRLPGTTLFALVGAMGLQRFAIEAFRFNEALEQTLLGLSVYQLVALGLMALGAGGLVWTRR
jgi:phosphatidylglycerol:prolipoprotein diacylglycerol transferase